MKVGIHGLPCSVAGIETVNALANTAAQPAGDHPFDAAGGVCNEGAKPFAANLLVGIDGA